MRTIFERGGRSAAGFFLAAISACALAGAGCSGGASSYASASADGGAAASSDAGAGVPQCLSSNECPTGWTCSEFNTCVPPKPGADGGTAPPETEVQFSAPESSLRYLYVAMPQLGELAKIDGATLDVSSVAVGDNPQVLATAPGSDTAVVLDSTHGTATVIRPTADRDEKTLLATLPHLNRLDIDPTGNYAVAWFDLDKAIADAGGIANVGEVGSFQDVTVIALNPAGKEHAVDLTVGFKPSKVEFDAAGTHAYVVTQDGVSVIDLAQATGAAGPSIAPPIPFTDDPSADPTDFEVDVVSSGSYAVVRESGHSSVGVVSLAGADTGHIYTIPLPAEPTDVDLSPDGSRAYAVLRDASKLAVIHLPAAAGDPTSVDLVDFGSQVIGQLVLSRDGSRGLLFTNAELKKQIAVVQLDKPGYPHVTYPLQKAVRAAAFAPDGDTALIIHAKAPGDPATADSFGEYIDRSYGYSMFDVGTGFSKLQITPVDPKAFAFAPKSPFAYLILDGGDAPGAVAQVQVIDLDTGVVKPIDLASPPNAVGVLPGAGSVFVSQRHPLGRVSFIDIATGAMRTVTGFDLNSSIID